MPSARISFGTDGWRGVIAEDFTFDNVRRVAQATADYWNTVARASRPLQREPGTGETPALPNSAIVGYDNRFLSEIYAKIVCEVLAGNGIQALYPPVAPPTPAVSYAVRDRNLCGAVMITASHNPPQFNGFKIKADYAGPADPDVCRQVEARIGQSPVRAISFDEAVRSGNIKIHDPRPAHVSAVKKLVDLNKIRHARLKVIVDSIHGCGGRVLESLIVGQPLRLPTAPAASEALARQQRRVQTIRANRDPLFGGVNPEPIGKNLGALCRAVKQARAAIGLATDGDADRMGVVDDRGRYVSIQLVFAMLLLHLIRHRRQTSGLVVKTANCTVLIDRICRAHGLECVEVPVGFKYVCAKMRETDVLIGGEESGGIGFQGHIPERDGILANLMLLEMLATEQRPVTQILADLQRQFGKSAYDRIDMRYPLEKRSKLIETLRRDPPPDLLGAPLAEMKDFDGVKYVAQDDSWLMFRASGTEPIIRIYSEAATAARVKKLLEYGKRLASQIAAG